MSAIGQTGQSEAKSECRQDKTIPTSLDQNSGQIFLMQALHNDKNGTCSLVIENQTR
jgi:hypothetical protein